MDAECEDTDEKRVLCALPYRALFGPTDNISQVRQFFSSLEIAGDPGSRDTPLFRGPFFCEQYLKFAAA